MVVNARIADLLREGRADEIGDAIAEGAFFDMQTFDDALIALVLGGEVDAETAANAASVRHDFLVALERARKEHGVAATPEPVTFEPEPEPVGLRIA
jgi:Tfp pilus assembly pilus retraction ATPase PilT